MVAIKHVQHVRQTKKLMQIEVHVNVRLDFKEIQQIASANVLLANIIEIQQEELSVVAIYAQTEPICQV